MPGLSSTARDTIRERRIACYDSQVAAALSAGVGPATWANVETGRSPAAPRIRIRMCRALGWTDDSIERLERGESAALAEVDPQAPGAAPNRDLAAAYEELAGEFKEFKDYVLRYVGEQSLKDRRQPKSS